MLYDDIIEKFNNSQNKACFFSLSFRCFMGDFLTFSLCYSVTEEFLPLPWLALKWPHLHVLSLGRMWWQLNWFPGWFPPNVNSVSSRFARKVQFCFAKYNKPGVEHDDMKSHRLARKRSKAGCFQKLECDGLSFAYHQESNSSVAPCRTAQLSAEKSLLVFQFPARSKFLKDITTNRHTRKPNKPRNSWYENKR